MLYTDPQHVKSIVVVPDEQLSLAIGREGQNVRLAAKLTGYKLDIKSISQIEQEGGLAYYEELAARMPTQGQDMSDSDLVEAHETEESEVSSEQVLEADGVEAEAGKLSPEPGNIAPEVDKSPEDEVAVAESSSEEEQADKAV
jgi:N utilization substance protein A